MRGQSYVVRGNFGKTFNLSDSLYNFDLWGDDILFFIDGGSRLCVDWLYVDDELLVVGLKLIKLFLALDHLEAFGPVKPCGSMRPHVIRFIFK